MDDPNHEPMEVPCPTCAEPSRSLVDMCDNCRIEREARELASAVASKYQAVGKSTDLGADM